MPFPGGMTRTAHASGQVLHLDGRPLRIGHRGAAALAPENTLRSLAVAVDLGVDAVEFDVLALDDGTLVLTHSNDLLEVSHGARRGLVRSQSLSELRRLAPELPTLDEALSFLAGRAPHVGLHVDLKATGFESALVEALRRHEAVGRALVSSAWHDSLRAVGALEPRVRLALAYPFDRLGLSRRKVLAPVTLAALVALRAGLPRRIGGLLERADATVASLHFAVVSRAVVRRCHERGAEVLAWTVDDPRLVRYLARAGVDGIISDDPRVVPATLRGT
jgi:glycerophosphoryl diester phosphodiesterase